MGKKNNSAQVEAMNRAIAEMQQARKRIDDVEGPDYEQMKDYIRQAAAENPELMGLFQEAQMGESALEDIAIDPKLRENQSKVIDELSELAETGMSDEDMAKRRELQRQVAQDEQARQKSIIQNLQERGLGGSGLELALRSGSSQESARRASEGADRLTSDMADRRRSALAQLSETAGRLRSQDYGEQKDLATTRDTIAQFNALQRANTANRNLQLRQGMENQRSAQNRQMYGNLGNLQQQRFSNDMQKAGAYANATAPIAQMQARNVARSQGPMGMIGTLAGAGIGGLASGGNPQAIGVGAQLGGAFGSGMQSNTAAFADGGVKPLTDSQMMGRQAEADYMNQQKFGDDAYRKAMYGERPTRSTAESFATFGEKLKNLVGSKEKPAFVPSEADKSAEYEEYKKGLSKPESKGDDKMKAIASVAQGLLDRKPAVEREEPVTVGRMADMDALASLGKTQLMDTSPVMSQAFADGGAKMAYNDGGEGTIIDSGMESYAGDELEDRINDGELVANLEQQDKLNDLLIELKRLKSDQRVDTMVNEGEKEINPDQQEALMSVLRGEIEVEDMPEDRILKDSGDTGISKLMSMLQRRKG